MIQGKLIPNPKSTWDEFVFSKMEEQIFGTCGGDEQNIFIEGKKAPVRERDRRGSRASVPQKLSLPGTFIEKTWELA